MQCLLHASKILKPSENLPLQVDVLQFIGRGITEHPLKGRIDAQKTPLIIGLIDTVRSIFDYGTKTRFRYAQRLHGSFPLRNVAIYNDHFFGHATRRRDSSCSGFEHSPRPVLVAHSVLQSPSNSRTPRFKGSLPHPLAVFWMDLLESR